MPGGGCGIDDPDDGYLSVALGNPRGRLKNFVCQGHVDLRPRGPLVFGVEFRRLETTYASGKFTANHFNLAAGDRKSTRLNSSHGYISYAVFCLKKKKKNYTSRQ